MNKPEGQKLEVVSQKPEARSQEKRTSRRRIELLEEGEKKKQNKEDLSFLKKEKEI